MNAIVIQLVSNNISQDPKYKSGAARQRALRRRHNRVGAARTQCIEPRAVHVSGGMAQRVMIAMALACKPALLIADEPTTALDVTVQAQIVELLLELQADMGMAILFISHDLGVVSEIADHIVVMYAGRIIERAPAGELFRQPRHPYTRALFETIPQVARRQRRLPMIPGSAPGAWPTGCRFRDRCPYAEDRCAEAEPALKPVVFGHAVACVVASQ